MFSAIIGLLIVALYLVAKTIDTLSTKLPYVSGLLVVFFLLYAFPGLKDIIPGESKTSIFAIIAIVEILLVFFIHNEQTSGPIIVFSSMFFIAVAMIIASSGLEIASWQKAIFVTIIYLIATFAVISSNVDSLIESRQRERNLVASIMVSIINAATVGMNVFIVFECIWAKYIKFHSSEGFYKVFDNGGLVIIAGAMIVTIAVSLIRDRRQELLY
jgi:hypothetical protein